MSGSVDNPRSFLLAAVLLSAIAVLASTGCRSFSSNQAAPTILPAPTPEISSGAAVSSQPPPLILGNAPSSNPLPLPSTSSPAPTEERIIAFRPIVPGQETVSKDIPPTVSPIPLAPSSSQVDELNRRIKSLEKTLAETEKKLQEVQLPAPIPDTPKPDLEKLLPEPIPAVSTMVQKPVKPLPAFAISGVSVVSDGDRIRIEVADSALFTPGTWQLNTTSEETLRKIVGEIRAVAPEATLEIEGHTDNILADPKNTTQKHDLSSYKAMIVMQYFVKTLLWPSTKITMSGYGPSRPVADNATPEGRARNNRIDIVVKP